MVTSGSWKVLKWIFGEKYFKIRQVPLSQVSRLFSKSSSMFLSLPAKSLNQSMNCSLVTINLYVMLLCTLNLNLNLTLFSFV